MNKHIGSSFDSLLEEEGVREEVDRRAFRLLEVKRGIAAAIEAAMLQGRFSKQGLAQRMGTSRSLVYRLLDPRDTSVTLDTVVRAENALDVRLLSVAPPRPGR